MGRPRKYDDPVEMTWRTERSIRERLHRFVHGRLDMNDVVNRAVLELLEREERPAILDDPKRNLTW